MAETYTGRKAVTSMPPITSSYRALGMLLATVKALDTSVVPMPKACAQVRKKPVMRLTITRPLMSAAERPTSASDASSSSTPSASPPSGAGAPAPSVSTGAAGNSSSSQASGSSSPTSANCADSSGRGALNPADAGESYWEAIMKAAVSSGEATAGARNPSSAGAAADVRRDGSTPAEMRKAVVSSGEAGRSRRGAAGRGARVPALGSAPLKCAPRGRPPSSCSKSSAMRPPYPFLQIAATAAPVCATRSPGASFNCMPRLPPEMKIWP